MGENVSVVLQKKLPPKCKDRGMFTIPYKLGNIRIERAMLDLGASINVMPLSIYSSLNVGPLKETGVIIQLADRSNVYPEGVLDDVLVQVNELIFPTDFYVLDMQEDDYSKSTSILLGRPFLKTARTKIDIDYGTLTMEFDGEIIKFNIYDAMRCPGDVSSVFVMDFIDPSVHESFYLNNDYKLKVALNMNFTLEGLQGIMKESVLDLDLQDTIQELESLKPMRYDTPKLKTKPLSNHLNHVYLGEEETIPVIIPNKISRFEEEKLIQMLREYKEAIGWRKKFYEIQGLDTEECAPPTVLSAPPDPHLRSVRESTQPTHSAFTPIS
ncbi:uncharacterized protein LOC120195676 [Hibiscus syriacus]|uniref:uncharacterized protein LOC120195676 n=1 Tax=Hibiscus syriacus TaxID=106335 RepID=UPI001924B4C0|nr:uncharacterized protein LOC120195676 [Hibiscus syriacus]